MELFWKFSNKSDHIYVLWVTSLMSGNSKIRVFKVEVGDVSITMSN